MNPISMVSAGSYLQLPLPPQLWATPTRQEYIVELTKDDDEIVIWLEIWVSHGIRPLPPARMLIILPHHLRTLERMAMGPQPKVLFDFGLDDSHAWSQVSLAGPRTSSIAETILDVVYFLR